MTPLDWLIGIGSGMGILVSVTAAFWFVMRSSLEPLKLFVDILGKKVDKLETDMRGQDDKYDAQFALVRDGLSKIREDTGGHRRSPSP